MSRFDVMPRETWKLEPPATEEFYGRAIVIENTGGADREHGGTILGQIQVVIIDEHKIGDHDDPERNEAANQLATHIHRYLNSETSA